MDNTPPSNTGTYLVIIVGILAAVALVLGVMSLKQSAALADRIGEVPFADVAARVEAMDKASKDALKAANEAKANLSNLAVTTQRAFDDVGSELSTMRTTLNRLSTDTQTVANRVAGSEGRSGGSRPPPSDGAESPTTATEPATLTPAGTYIVKSGDTLGSIGRQLGIPWQQIAAANPQIDPNRLRVDQELNIPQGN